jgi:hypothetical protein
MVAHRLTLETPEERIVYWSIVSTWGLWLLGAVFVVFPLVGWALAALAVARRLGWLPAPHNDRAGPVPVLVGAWLLGMALMLVALIIGHLDAELPWTQTVKSTLGWVKGWALLAVFPFAGALLVIRARVIVRAMCFLGLQTLLLTPLLIAGALADLPISLYVSPLHKLIGSEEIFYDVGLHVKDGGMFGFRLRYFAPWAPGAACVGVLTIMLARAEKHRGWAAIGIVAGLSMCLFSVSRTALVAIPAVLIAVWIISNIAKPIVMGCAGIALALGLLFAEPVLQAASDAEAAFRGARAESSRVRATIQRMGVHRWQTEAPWFGHAVVERGPHLVEFMPIGSHHTWIGLLFTKGLVGFLACLLPLLWTLTELSARAQADRLARCSLATMLALLVFSFGENLDVLAYLVWPVFLLLGIVAKRRVVFGSPESRARARLAYNAAIEAAHKDLGGPIRTSVPRA